MRTGRSLGLHAAESKRLEAMTARVELAELLDDLYGLVLLVGRLRNSVRLRSTPYDKSLEAGSEGSDGGRRARVNVKVEPVVQAHGALGHQLDLPRREEQEVDWCDHGHALAGDGPRPDLLVEDKERNGKGERFLGAVDARLVDEGRPGLSCQNLPLLLVHADVRVEPHGQQGNHHVQLGVRSSEIVVLGRETLLREAAGDEKLLELVLGLPGHPHRRHVKTLVVTVIDLSSLATLTSILPTLKQRNQCLFSHIQK